MTPEEEKENISILFKALIAGYKAKDWVFSHECEQCLAGANDLSEGKVITVENIHEKICPEVAKELKKVALADMIIAHFDEAIIFLDKIKQEMYSQKFLEKHILKVKPENYNS